MRLSSGFVLAALTASRAYVEEPAPLPTALPAAAPTTAVDRPDGNIRIAESDTPIADFERGAADAERECWIADLGLAGIAAGDERDGDNHAGK